MGGGHRDAKRRLSPPAKGFVRSDRAKEASIDGTDDSAVLPQTDSAVLPQAT